MLNKFLETPIQLCYIKSEISQGVVDIRIGEAGTEYSWQAVRKLPIFVRLIALSNPLSRLKSYMLPRLAFMFIDEFIVNLYLGEKYLQQEDFLIKELYTTYNRECIPGHPIRILAAGNPYSTYNPLFESLHVDTNKLTPGAFVVGPNYTINCFKVGDELLEKIYAANPQYQFDDEYAKYAFGGEAVNDANIRIQKTEPKGYHLKFVFKMGNCYLSIHERGSDSMSLDLPAFWLCTHDSSWARTISKRRHVLVFNFADLGTGARIMDINDMKKMLKFKDAMKKGNVWCNGVAAYYKAQDVYGAV